MKEATLLPINGIKLKVFKAYVPMCLIYLQGNPQVK